MSKCESVSSLSEFISAYEEAKNSMPLFKETVWFRAENKEEKLLLPKLYFNLKDKDKRIEIENNINQEFRMRAPALFNKTPAYKRIDEWLFLMQHNGLWSRLLDWSTGALIALFFAVNEAAYEDGDYSPVVWVLNPIALNFFCNKRNFLPLSWNDGSNWYKKHRPFLHSNTKKYGYELKKCPGNILAAWKDNKYEEKYPIALKPQHIHPRVTAQRGCFTVFGKDNSGIKNLFKDIPIKKLLTNEHRLLYGNNNEFDSFLENSGNKQFNEVFLIKIKICPEKKVLKKIANELYRAGISNSTLMPDLEGLAKELINIYGKK